MVKNEFTKPPIIKYMFEKLVNLKKRMIKKIPQDGIFVANFKIGCFLPFVFQNFSTLPDLLLELNQSRR